MAPPDRPLLLPPAPVAEAVGELVDVFEGKRGGMDVVVGKCTPSHLFSTLEFTQQESVAFGELDAQKEHSPGRFDAYPQSFGSFSTATTQDLLKDAGGIEQSVKSALISLSAFGPLVPHSSGLAVISCSLIANWAHESAHSGLELLEVRPQGSMEFWTMALQITVVV
jgi:hypothetical protein